MGWRVVHIVFAVVVFVVVVVVVVVVVEEDLLGVQIQCTVF